MSISTRRAPNNPAARVRAAAPLGFGDTAEFDSFLVDDFRNHRDHHLCARGTVGHHDSLGNKGICSSATCGG